jgi:hypothetical protein
VPAAAVIPAPIAYINVVVVKKLVVGYRSLANGFMRMKLFKQLLIGRGLSLA